MESSQGMDLTNWRFSLAPVLALMEVLKLYEFGVQKHGLHDWLANPKDYSYFADKLMRHWLKWWSRSENTDPEHGLSHLTAVVFMALSLLEYQIRGLGNDDRPQDMSAGK